MTALRLFVSGRPRSGRAKSARHVQDGVRAPRRLLELLDGLDGRQNDELELAPCGLALHIIRNGKLP
jgi:hypothetical protein